MITREALKLDQRQLGRGQRNVTDPIDGGLKLAAHQNGVAASSGCRGAHSELLVRLPGLWKLEQVSCESHHLLIHANVMDRCCR